jgi:hypothetical protein
MKIELTKEQIAYLKSLDSKKKKRKFLLDCLIENVEIDNSEITKTIPTGNVIEDSINFGVDSINMISKAFKVAFKAREIKESQELIEKSNEVAKLPTDFCVEITDENRLLLERIWCEINKKTQVLFLGKYIISNSLLTHFYSCKSHKNLPIVTTDEFLKYIGREDLISDIEFDKNGNWRFKKPNHSPEEIELVKHNINQREVTDQGSELLKFDMLEDIDFAGKRQQKLFKYLSQECNFTALKSQMDDIESIVLEMNKYNENAN